MSVERPFTVSLTVAELTLVLGALRTTARVFAGCSRPPVREIFEVDCLVSEICKQAGVELPDGMKTITEDRGQA